MPNQSPKIPLLLLSEAARICPFSIRMDEGWPTTLPVCDLAQLMAGATPSERKDWGAVVQYSIDKSLLATIKIRKASPQVAVIGRNDLPHVTREATAAWLANIGKTPSEHVAAWLLSGGITLPTAADSEHAEAPTVDTNRLVAWQASTLENWRQITERYGSTPTAREVMSWLRSNGPRDVFPEQQNERNRLLWIDTYGISQTVSYSRVASVLSAWRKSGKIAAR